MVGAPKQRAYKAKDHSSEDASHSSKEAKSGARSSPQSIPRMDGNRDPAEARNTALISNTRVELDTNAWAINLQESTWEPPRRSGLSTIGNPVKEVGLNVFEAKVDDKKKIYQYDVSVELENGIELKEVGEVKRGLIKKLWFSPPVQAVVGEYTIFDGAHQAWATFEKKETKILVDLDKEYPQDKRPPRKDGSTPDNKFVLVIKCAKRIELNTLLGYIRTQCDFDPSCLEAINFLDHVLREGPSRKMIPAKRSFFSRPEQPYLLANHLEAWKGVFASLKATNGLGKPTLAVNIDVSNGVFYTPIMLETAILSITGLPNAKRLGEVFRDAGQTFEGWHKSSLKAHFGKVRRVGIQVKSIGGMGIRRFIVDKIGRDSARNHKFEWNDPLNPNLKKDGKISVEDYNRIKYQEKVIGALPVVETTKGQLFPLGWCKIMSDQRYTLKLDDAEVAEMIKFAVQRPALRWKSAQEAVSKLDWQQDKYLKHFGISVATNRTSVTGRQLPAPDLIFAGQGSNAQIAGGQASSGRWRIDGKKFYMSNAHPAERWGVVALTDSMNRHVISKPEVDKFVKSLQEIWAAHGGRFLGNPKIKLVNGSNELGTQATDCWNECAKSGAEPPQFIVVILPRRDPMQYYRLKKSFDCRFGVATQFVQSSHVKKCQSQYISNVCMKINAKLGGCTNLAVLPKNVVQTVSSYYKDKKPRLIGRSDVMIIGADVSHAAPGSEMPSTVAITVSQDKGCVTYSAYCNTNGFRTEIITPGNLRGVASHIREWCMNIGKGNPPKTIVYMRDGVSEAQCREVNDQEVAGLKAMVEQICKDGALHPSYWPKFVAVVVSKRHHVRFFPTANADRNGNPKPGLLVDTGICHPFFNDWYLCAHSAIQGTARPVHYNVIMNEVPDLRTEELQVWLYSHSYQYVRSTTPVSLHPAIYYAHLASLRSKAHEPLPAQLQKRVEAAWQTELDTRHERQKANAEAKKNNKAPPYTPQQCSTDKETMKAAFIPGVPKGWHPEKGAPMPDLQQRMGEDLMELFAKNNPKFPRSMWFV